MQLHLFSVENVSILSFQHLIPNIIIYFKYQASILIFKSPVQPSNTLTTIPTFSYEMNLYEKAQKVQPKYTGSIC